MRVFEYKVLWWATIAQRIRIFSGRRRMVIALAALMTFAACWSLSLWRGIPVPRIYGEYSNLLAADTFAHGRLTNPTPPLWVHFETFNEIVKPSYATRYPPGQGLFLALGQRLTGQPIYGVWISAALMSAAICWMLYAWLPPLWVMIGGLVGALQFGIFCYWSYSYWGQDAAALGGALVFGALARLRQNPRLRDTLWLGLGVLILFNTRPLEGALVGIPVGILVLPWKKSKAPLSKRSLWGKIVVPFGFLLALSVVLTLGYNQKVTGDPFVFPHRLNASLYTRVPLFLWQDLRTVHFNDKELENFDRDAPVQYFIFKKTWKGFWKCIKSDSARMFNFFLGYPLGGAALLMILFMAPGRIFYWRIGLMAAAFLAIFMVMATPAKGHYYAAWTALIVLLITWGLRFLVWVKIGNRRLGTAFVVFLMAVQIGWDLARYPDYNRDPSRAKVLEWTGGQKNPIPGVWTREQLKSKLLKAGGKHLVIQDDISNYMGYVSYSDLRDWVFNDADIPSSPIIWARRIGDQEETKLKAYFKDRHVWYVQVLPGGTAPINTYDQR